MRSSEEAGTDVERVNIRPWRAALIYAACFFTAYVLAQFIVGLIYSSVFSPPFLLGTLFIYGSPISVAVGLLVLLVRSLRNQLSPAGTAFVVALTISILTVVLTFAPALFSKTNPHLFSSFMISIFYTLPVTLGVVVAAAAAAWVETRISRG